MNEIVDIAGMVGHRRLSLTEDPLSVDDVLVERLLPDGELMFSRKDSVGAFFELESPVIASSYQYIFYGGRSETND